MNCPTTPTTPCGASPQPSDPPTPATPWSREEEEEHRGGKRPRLEATSFYHRCPPKASSASPRAVRVYRTFAKQAQAFEFVEKLSGSAAEPLRVFAEELRRDGSRQYIVTSYLTFWRRHIRGAPPRYFSEVIHEAQPCHLYFDVEFPIALNPNSDGEAMVAFFRARVLRSLLVRCQITQSRVEVVELDATTRAKFSRHLVFRVSGAAFANNTCVGAFVRDTCVELENDARSSCGEAKILLVQCNGDNEDDTQLFVDLGVYTRNRCFRLYKCAKFGRSNELLPCGVSLEEAEGYPEREDRRWFTRSLVCNVSPTAFLIRYGPDPNAAAQQPSLAEPTAVVASRASLAHLEQFLVQLWESRMLDSEFDPHRWWGDGEHGAPSRPPSPRPSHTRVRSCMEVGGPACVLVFVLGNNRWCERMQRQHRSNGVRLVVNVEAGTVHQRCFDPDCAQFRSRTFPVPPWLLEPLRTPATPLSPLASK